MLKLSDTMIFDLQYIECQERRHGCGVNSIGENTKNALLRRGLIEIKDRKFFDVFSGRYYVSPALMLTASGQFLFDSGQIQAWK